MLPVAADWKTPLVVFQSFAQANESQFDVVTCLEMLEHVPEPQSVISACAKSQNAFDLKSLGVDTENIEINNSDFFEKIDSMVKSERLIDLMPALDLEQCSIIEAYYSYCSRTSSRAR